MSDASWALQKSIHAALVGDAAITAILGGPSIFDDVPQKSAFPYLTLGQSVVRDWSTATEDGTEHLLTIHVWSRAEGRRQTYALIDLLRGALHDARLPLEGHHLVNLQHQFSDVRRETDGETYHGLVRLRAVVEPL